jgi:hypothetical protein
MKRAIFLASVLAFAAGELPALAAPPAKAKTKKKKKKEKEKPAAPAKEEPPKKVAPIVPTEEPKEPTRAVVAPPTDEELRVEEGKRKEEAEQRKESQVTPGTASRWSNKGAMVPIESPVPITAELPERAVPIASGVQTPGQALLSVQQEVLSARLSFGGYHLQTKGQRQTFVPGDRAQDIATPMLDAGTRDIDFLRARATMGYQHIAGSDFALKLDAEYRPQISGSRFTDWRINELYASYGLTEQRDPEAPWWGLALGRLAIREAGYAQADGLAFRFKVADWLRFGVFGGITGNPYGYNWTQKKTQVISADWITGGAFAGVETNDLIVNLAGVVTYANINPLLKDLDRLYLYLDAAYLILPELNVVLNGWLDILPGGQVVQNIDGTIFWAPIEELSLSLGGGRFTTVTYEATTNYTYVANGTNLYNPNLGPVVGVDEQPVVPYDAVQQTTIYNTARLRAGYRVLRDLDVNAKFDFFHRDGSAYQAQLQAVAGNTIRPSPIRMLPGASVRYRNPDIIDANVGFTYIIDKESQADAAIDFGIGRGFYGVYLGGDGRYYFGAIGAFDGGFSLSYTFPREWFPGVLVLRGTFRYFRENVNVFQPISGNNMIMRNDDGTIMGWTLIENQESILGFGGIEWRL